MGEKLEMHRKACGSRQKCLRRPKQTHRSLDLQEAWQFSTGQDKALRVLLCCESSDPAESNSPRGHGARADRTAQELWNIVLDAEHHQDYWPAGC